MHQAYLQQLTPKIARDGRIKAAWLEGSFGRGNPDRYADLDIHLWLSEADLPRFRSQIEPWLASIRPLVLFKRMFNDRMVNALTQDGLRLDIVLHSEPMITLDPSRTRVLFQTEGALQFGPVASVTDPAATAQALREQTQEFWRCISLLPSVVGRQELIVGLVGLSVEVNLLTEVLIRGYGVVRDSGVKRLNPFLPDNLQQTLEDALAMQGLSGASLVRAHLRLAEVMHTHGPVIADKHQYAYPAELEAVALAYVQREIDLLGLERQVD